jgi:hypothetical protein
MSPPDGLHACFRKSEVFDLALPDEILHGSRHILDRHVRVDAMLIKQIDGVGPEPLERGLGDLLDVLRPAISRPRCWLVTGSISKPNLVAIVTCLRTGARASPTSSSFVNGP